MKAMVQMVWAILVDSLTDNRNRTSADLRHIFSKNGGNLGEAGSVAWMFERKGVLLIERNELGEQRGRDLTSCNGTWCRGHRSV